MSDVGEPGAATKTSPVQNISCDIGDIVNKGYGIYLVYQSANDGTFWNRNTGVFEALDADNCDAYTAQA